MGGPFGLVTEAYVLLLDSGPAIKCVGCFLTLVDLLTSEAFVGRAPWPGVIPIAMLLSEVSSCTAAP